MFQRSSHHPFQSNTRVGGHSFELSALIPTSVAPIHSPFYPPCSMVFPKVCPREEKRKFAPEGGARRVSAQGRYHYRQKSIKHPGATSSEDSQADYRDALSSFLLIVLVDIFAGILTLDSWPARLVWYGLQCSDAERLGRLLHSETFCTQHDGDRSPRGALTRRLAPSSIVCTFPLRQAPASNSSDYGGVATESRRLVTADSLDNWSYKRPRQADP